MMLTISPKTSLPGGDGAWPTWCMLSGARVRISSLHYARAGPDREGMLYMTIHDVLFATDFSDASRLAGETAAEFARHFGARLHVLHVVPLVTDPTPAPAALRAVAAELEKGLSIVTAIASGRVARQVVDYAHRNAIDLIVLGTHGRTGVSHALLGSVAEAVTRRARCRVLTVPATLPGTSTAPALIEEAEKPTFCMVCGAETGTSSSAKRAERGSAVRRSTTSSTSSAPVGEPSHGGYATERKSGSAAVP